MDTSNLMSGLIGAVVGGFLSFLGSWYSSKRILKTEEERANQSRIIEKQNRDIDLILNFDDRFSSESFMRIRSKAAGSIELFREDLVATKRKMPESSSSSDTLVRILHDTSNVKEDVFDFFEGVGLVFRRYNLDEELVWSTFFYWVQGYWQAAAEHISVTRENDNTIWEDFEYLYHQLSEIEKKKRKCTDTDLVLDEGYILDFLENEKHL